MACFRAPKATKPEALADELRQLGREVLVVGDGGCRYAECFSSIAGVEVADATEAFPLAAVVAEVAAKRLGAGAPPDRVEPAGSLGILRPFYLREPDVRIGWAERDRPAGTPAAPAGTPAGGHR